MGNRYIKDLIKSMTLKEKVGQLNQKLYGWNVYKKTGDKFELTDEFKEHVKWGGGIGAIYGVLRADAWSGISFLNGISKEDSKKVIDMIREYVSNNTRLKIPVLFSEECTHGHQGLNGEMYPCSLGMGSSWNDELVKGVFKEISNEIAVKGVNLALVSSLDVLRDPRWGRAEECYSEDPYLSSKYTEAIVKGVNNKTNENGVTVVLKHLCAQGEPVGGHNSGAASIGERELREIFLPPVKSGVSSGALGFMAAYNEIDGVPCHINKKLLTDTLRDEYKFEGVVMADGCALDRLLLLSGNVELAAKLALEAGVDLSLWDDIYTSIEKAVDSGVLDIKYVDRAVYRILDLKNKLGLFNKEK
ncbi:glycoside hydrolase family 3 protein, partial [Clostridium chrysemydis]|uniref:glycoside hydrolase family 3 protein n=1 Tax=Clostridium chrysemydis TaxID=2665504 RepID=UPI003F3FE9CC